MMIYLDSEFNCHAITADDRIEVEAPENFVGMCDKAIECMRYVPAGMTYTDANGTVIHGEFIQCLDSASATAYQVQYESTKAEMDDMRTALELMGVMPDE